MSKTASQIVDRALTLIDEVVTSFDTAATTETSIRDVALEVLPEVCRDLIKELPWDLKRYLATNGNLSPDSLINGETQTNNFKKKLAFLAPPNFWELVSLRLTVWSKPVTEYIYINSEHYSKQNNPFTRAGKQNPVVALNNTSIGSNPRIECYSVEQGDAETVANFQYISFDNIPNDTDISWPDELFESITLALSNKLNLIKSRIEDAGIKGQEISNNIDQHE